MTQTAKHSKGPWSLRDGSFIDAPTFNNLAQVRAAHVTDQLEAKANARLIAATPDLLEACQMQEKAELANANCEECEGEGIPELCQKCFPLFDDARVARRLAIAKATKV
jgi:hypothetical protein